VVRSQKYIFELILKKAEPEKIQTFENFKEHWSRSISAGSSRRMDDS